MLTTEATTHRTDVCLCGAVQYDCPCPGPKLVRVIHDSCQACMDRPQRGLLNGQDAYGKIDPEQASLSGAMSCMSREDADSNRAIRLAVFSVLGDLDGKPLPNPHSLVAEVHQRVPVPEMWTQLVRDLIAEALGEARIRRDAQESLVASYDRSEFEAIADRVLAGRRPVPGDERGLGIAVASVMRRSGGRADPKHIRDYLRSKIAS